MNWKLIAGAGFGALAIARLFTSTETPSVPSTPAKEQPKEKDKTDVLVKAAPSVEKASTAQTEKKVEESNQNKPRARKVVQQYSAKYVIIGTGTAGWFAVRGILDNDPDAQIIMVGEEESLPYMRTPLSKELWFRDTETVSDPDDYTFTDWGGQERSIYYTRKENIKDVSEVSGPEGKPGTAILFGNKVTDLNIHAKRLKLSDGSIIKYDKCLLATGGTPKNIPLFSLVDEDIKKHIHLYRGVKEFSSLQSILQNPNTKRVAVIGGGFLGSELSVAFAQQSKSKTNPVAVTQVFPEDANMAKVLPEYLSKWSTEKVQNEGVTVVPQSRVVGIRKNESGSLDLNLSSGKVLTADEVVVAVGIEPNVELAKQARLEIDPVKGGIVVNAELEARSDLWVAGDVASFYDVVLGRRREEHHDHAVVSGRLAGENMTGARKSYTHQSMFWSDLGPDAGYEAIGIIDSKLPTIGIWAAASPSDSPSGAALKAQGKDNDTPKETKLTPDGYGKGVVFYMRDKAVVGVVLWNLYNKIPIARKVIRSQKKYENPKDLAKLFKVHDSD